MTDQSPRVSPAPATTRASWVVRVAVVGVLMLSAGIAGYSIGLPKDLPAAGSSSPRTPAEAQEELISLLDMMQASDITTQAEEYSALHYFSVYMDQMALADRFLGGIEGKRVFEMGPGRSLANGVLLVVSGAVTYDSVEVYGDSRRTEPMPYRLGLELLEAIDYRSIRRDPAGVAALVDGRVQPNPELVRLQMRAPDNYTLDTEDGSIDLAYSTSVFEHVGDPAYHLALQCRKLKVGGVLVANIDLRDHLAFHAPFTFLKDDEAARAAREQHSTGQGQNSWRAADFRDEVARLKLNVLEWRVNADALPPYRPAVWAPDAVVTEEMRATFAPRFKAMSLEDLSVQLLTIIARKEATTTCGT